MDDVPQKHDAARGLSERSYRVGRVTLRCVGAGPLGSHARGAARPDSDVDLVKLCEKPEALANRNDWVARFGEVREAIPEEYGMIRARRVFYQDGLEVECGRVVGVGPPTDRRPEPHSSRRRASA